MIRKHGDYIHLIFDCESDREYYIKGHVSLEYAAHTIRGEEDIEISSISYKYGRLVNIGPEHEDCLDGLTSTFRVINEPRKSYYPITECKP